MTSFSRSDLSTFLEQPLASPLCRRSQKSCEAASKSDQVGEDITAQRTGAVKAGDLLLKKTGGYLLKSPPALHNHCAERNFDDEVRTTSVSMRRYKLLYSVLLLGSVFVIYDLYHVSFPHSHRVYRPFIRAHIVPTFHIIVHQVFILMS